MYVIFGSKKCPICGTVGKKIKTEHFCPACGTVFNQFGILNFEGEHGDIEWT